MATTTSTSGQILIESVVLLLFCSGFILGIGVIARESNRISKISQFQSKEGKKIYVK